eukprot:4783412-Pleurochrysis_carterae.AAC.1
MAKQNKNKTKFKPGGLRNFRENSAHKTADVAATLVSSWRGHRRCLADAERAATKHNQILWRPGSIIILSAWHQQCQQILSPTVNTSLTEDSNEKEGYTWHAVAKN